MIRSGICCLLVLCSGFLPNLSAAEPQPSRAPQPGPREIAFFENKVRPLLLERCSQCHGAKKQRGGLRLDTRAGLLRGSDSGAVLKPGDVDGSLLIRMIRPTAMTRMPPRNPLSPAEIAILEEWVRKGAAWPTDQLTGQAEAWKRHWAFQPIRKPGFPEVKNAGWVRSPIDRFILARLEQKRLSPSPPADRRTLIRRATFDLIGLPPTPEEVEAFVKESESRPQAAYQALIERLLDSPHYGERWGRHWLDVARYADTKGYVFFEEQKYPWAWTYRDYVVRAFNADLPYNQFILEQLAADQLLLHKPEAPAPGQSSPGAGASGLWADRRKLPAMGFLTVGDHFMSNPYDIVDDRINVVSRGLLGLTVSCARCHDHKFDPIPTRDYYSLYGVFASSVEPAEPPLFEEPPRTPQYAAFVKELETRQKKLTDFVRSKQNVVLTEARTRAAEYLLAAHDARDQPAEDDFMLLADKGDLNPTMLIRWRAYLNRTARAHHPVWSLWHRLAALSGEPPSTATFPARAAQLLTDLADRPDLARPINAKLLQALRSASRPVSRKWLGVLASCSTRTSRS